MNRINITIKLKSIVFFNILFLILLFNSAVGAGVETTVAGTHSIENGQVCTDCHKFDEVNKNSNPDVLPVASKPENSNVKISGNALIQSGSLLQGGGPDCVFCHDINGNGAPLDKRIDASSIKQGVHRNLNNGVINTTVLSDTIDKACWACHGNGTEPGQHPDNYKTPYMCADCHNATYSLNFTDPSKISNLTTRKVYEHIQPPYYQEINSILNSSNATCTGCHNMSRINYTLTFRVS
jgi:cytochrome c553